MIKKILFVLMAIVVVLPTYPINLSQVFAEGPVNLGPVETYAPEGTPAHSIYQDDKGRSYWVGSNGYLLRTGNTGHELFGKILIHDYLNESPAHNYEAGQPQGSYKEKFSEILNLIQDPESREDRNGWSGYHKACGPDGTWVEENRYATDYSNPIHEYIPTEAEWAMYEEGLKDTPVMAVKEHNDKYTAMIEYIKLNKVHGHSSGSLLEQLPQYNQLVIKKADGTYDSYTSQSADCTPGEEHVYYNDLDFSITMVYTIPEIPPETICIPGEPDCPTPGNDCPPGTDPCPDPICIPGADGCPETIITGCPQTNPDCHPETETGCPHAPAPGEVCASDDMPAGDVRVFETQPRTYAELKEGTVYGEKWGAMEGVPTTQNLYYGIGGNEYMVKVELELVRGQTAERDYSFEQLTLAR